MRTLSGHRAKRSRNTGTSYPCSNLNRAPADPGVKLKAGQTIDATFVPVPIQRNGREDDSLIKADAVPINWGKTPAQMAHKDIDARWTKKGGPNHLGYKTHINVYRGTDLITAHACTPASVHHIQMLDTALRPENEGCQEVGSDSAFRSDEHEQPDSGRPPWYRS